MPARRVVLLGKTGNGKSSTGNSILGYPAFDHMVSISSVTQCLKMCFGTNPVNKLEYWVCDTPGLLDTDVSLIDRLLEVQKAVETCKKPHAFLLVFSSAARFSADEQHTVDIIRILFGEKIFNHSVIVFTRGNDLKTDDHFKKYLESSKCFVNLLQKCGDRVVRIENNDGPNVQCDNRRLLEMIEKVSNGGKQVYQYSFLDSHKKVLIAYAEKHRVSKTEIEEHLANISKNLDEQLIADHEALKSDNKTLEKDLQKLKVENDTLKDRMQKLEGNMRKRDDAKDSGGLFHRVCGALDLATSAYRTYRTMTAPTYEYEFVNMAVEEGASSTGSLADAIGQEVLDDIVKNVTNKNNP